MAISINWATKVINVPQAYLTPVSGSLYELDTNQFRLDLKALEASEAGSVFDDTHRHNTEVTVAGVTYAKFFEIINGYTVTFEDGAYRVRLAGTNNNISDVQNLNQVSLLTQNSAGLIVGGDGGAADWSATEKNQIRHRLGVDGTTSQPVAASSIVSSVVTGMRTESYDGVPFDELLAILLAVAKGNYTKVAAYTYDILDQQGAPLFRVQKDASGNRVVS